MRTNPVNAATAAAEAGEDRDIPAEEAATTTELGLGLQLSRAGMMALTRLQLAIQSGDRQLALEAMDRLHALDAEMERLVGRLPAPAGSEAEWASIARHVGDQKLAIAFEKLALVSEISGPDLVSERAIPLPRIEPEQPIAELPPLPDWPALPAVEPAEWRPAASGLLALVLALVVTALLAAAAVLMTAM
jgi:hypothetical protein